MPVPISRALTALAFGLLVRTAPAATPASVPPSPPEPSIENVAWQLVGYGTEDGFAEVPADTKPAYFRFASGQVSGDTGCNRISGAYRASGETLAFDSGLATTRKACPKPLMIQERSLLFALGLVAAYRIEGDRLLMLDAEGDPVLEFRAASRSPLVGHVWQLEGYDDGSGNLAPPLGGAGIDLTFLGTGVLGGSDGCNRYMSGYRELKQRLTIGPIATTRIRCLEGDDRTDQAGIYAEVLGHVAGFRIQGQTLTLLSVDGKPMARYRALEVSTPANDAEP
ncbi:META domain-containing protein [Imhoffiella purpurea]|uniref:DUF306 domain-containing protein n=1 Tax=Imhoffiella purpurea TaxID=1249627 RepID=W9VBP7_9GAMM|nr:META domain-containing protein [Imhoffiella purpurea]EXJ13467.1 Hypothetical protein D779_3729 [Imhoffiella purpurea]